MVALKIENVSTWHQYWSFDPRRYLYAGSETYEAKAKRIAQVMNASEEFQFWCDQDQIQTVTVGLKTMMQLKKQSQILMLSSIKNVLSPALTIDKLEIMLCSWYFENYSLGFCLGMLCHELGVHALATLSMTQKHTGVRTKSPAMVSEETSENQLIPEPEIGPGRNVQIRPSAAPQRDHAYAATPGRERYHFYQNLVVSIAYTLSQTKFADRKAEITNLFDCYLMDVASILATGDKRGKGMAPEWSGLGVGPAAIADVYNARREDLEEYLRKGNELPELVQLLPARKTATGVTTNYLGLMWALGGAFGWNYSTTWGKWWKED
ncbi:hypothetical protein D7X74_03320 [Corallococcus sp. CA047B]|uniref:hypothetical protein n=1 Tax=Corallococcus sp. CA047B TaxID=2316729 RepID=UPI000EA32159|nr:hypothetical protein [Corallococcus sp. CA047B]RKH20775.1 hypothetical protein D7X74_03320 [Corallococcus sp. CA047B]